MRGPGPLALTVSPFRRPPPDAALCEAKAACHYPNNARIVREARARGFQNALSLDQEGNVAETASTNVFMVRDGVVLTPVANGTFLNGITRQRVIGAAARRRRRGGGGGADRRGFRRGRRDFPHRQRQQGDAGDPLRGPRSRRRRRWRRGRARSTGTSRTRTGGRRDRAGLPADDAGRRDRAGRAGRRCCVPATRPVPVPAAGRDPDPGARGRGEPAGRAAARRAPMRRRRAPRTCRGSRRRARWPRSGPAASSLGGRRPGLRAAAGRRLCRICADAPGPRAAGAGAGSTMVGGGGALRDLLHRLDQRLRPRRGSGRARACSCTAARRGSARRRSSSPRARGARVFATAGSAEKCAACRGARRRAGDQLPRGGLRRGGARRRRAGAGSTWSSTWSAATTCRATCGRWRRTGGW